MHIQVGFGHKRRTGYTCVNSFIDFFKMTISLNTNRKSAPAFYSFPRQLDEEFAPVLLMLLLDRIIVKRVIDEGGHHELLLILLLLWYIR